MAIAKIIYKENASATPEVWMDTTDKTAAAGNMLSGTTALKNDGSTATGNIATKTSANLSASGATVTAPAGYYASDASKSVASGTEGTPTATKGTVSSHSVTVTPSVTNTAGYISGGTHTGTAVTVSASELVSGTKNITASGTTDVTNYASASVAAGSAATPATSITANPSISVSSGGLITASVSASQNVTPTVSAGYVSSGTAGTVSVSGSNTEQLTAQAATTYHPSTTDQTIASGKYLTGAQTIKAVVTTNLTAANIADGVTVKIGDSTDDDCVASITGTHSGGYSDDVMKALLKRNISSFTFPDGITSIGDYAFASCNYLTLSSLPSTITYIGQRAFYGCVKISFTSLPSNIAGIGAYTFYNCSKLALTSLPSGVTSIGEYAFYNCSELAITSLPSGITSIGTYAFYNCRELAITSLPSGITAISSYTFQYCIGITSISCDGAITTFSSGSFNGSSTYPMAITSASFPNMALTSNFSTAFGSTTAGNACQELTFVDIGTTTGIAANAFANCYKLQTLVLRKTSAVCSLSNVSAFLNTPLRGYNSLTGTVYVPNDLISSYQNATNWSTLYNGGTVTFQKIEGSIYDRS